MNLPNRQHEGEKKMQSSRVREEVKSRQHNNKQEMPRDTEGGGRHKDSNMFSL